MASFGTALMDVLSVSRNHVQAADPAQAQKAVLDAQTLFRFHRTQDALSRLDAALELMRGRWGTAIDAETRERALASATRVRGCVDSRQPPPMATLTVRVFHLDADAPAGHRTAAGAGVHVEVEDIRVGETAADGTLTVRVPSGQIHVRALIPSSSAGEGFIDVAAGGSATLSIVLDPDKEVVAVTDLVLVEREGDTIPATTTSLTLKFMRDGVFLPVTRIDAVDLLDRDEDIAEMLDKSFAVAGSTIAASDPAALHDLLAKYSGQRVGFRVQAVDESGATHANVVWLRMEPPPKQR